MFRCVFIFPFVYSLTWGPSRTLSLWIIISVIFFLCLHQYLFKYCVFLIVSYLTMSNVSNDVLYHSSFLFFAYVGLHVFKWSFISLNSLLLLNHLLRSQLKSLCYSLLQIFIWLFVKHIDSNYIKFSILSLIFLTYF